jgi:putative transposase
VEGGAPGAPPFLVCVIGGCPKHPVIPDLEPDYPSGARVRRVRSNGEIKWKGGLIYISGAIIGDPVGLVEIDNDVFEVHFYQRPIGRLDPSSDKLKPIPKHQPEKGHSQQKL